ncbi:MAG: PIN domain-containing protein [Pseudomonadota bacterium]
MDLIYFDYNCFQRNFDDPRQIRIQLEALACQQVFLLAEEEKVRLIWSFMHEDETALCPFPDRKYAVLLLASLCTLRVEPLAKIKEKADFIYKKGGFSAKDALHLACALHAEADFFLTCDDDIVRKAEKSDMKMAVVNPVDYIRKERT